MLNLQSLLFSALHSFTNVGFNNSHNTLIQTDINQFQRNIGRFCNNGERSIVYFIIVNRKDVSINYDFIYSVQRKNICRLRRENRTSSLRGLLFKTYQSFPNESFLWAFQQKDVIRIETGSTSSNL